MYRLFLKLFTSVTGYYGPFNFVCFLGSYNIGGLLLSLITNFYPWRTPSLELDPSESIEFSKLARCPPLPFYCFWRFPDTVAGRIEALVLGGAWFSILVALVLELMAGI